MDSYELFNVGTSYKTENEKWNNSSHMKTTSVWAESSELKRYIEIIKQENFEPGGGANS